MSARRDNPRYLNNGQHASDGGIINNIGRVEPLEELEDHCAFSATVVPGAHFDLPGCTEATQQRFLRTVEEWIDADGNVSTIPSGIFYVHGPGAGQLSALVQSVAEKFERKNQLAASFFASQNDSRHDNGHQMIPTLVLGLVEKFEINFAEDSIRRDRRLFKKNFHHQIQKLLVEPLLALNSEGLLTVPHPQLIVIDRLDECDAQVNLFSAIAQCIPQLPYSFRFLITNKTTKRITGVLDRNPETVIREYYLGNDLDGDVKIHTFLETEFKQICRACPSLPRAWPEQKDVTSLVQRCSGDSIYASAAIDIIRSPNYRPEDRLEVILKLQLPPEGDRCYDTLYALIFQEMESLEREKVALLLGALYFMSRGAGYFERLTSDYATIESILLLKPGEIKVLLNSVAFLIQVGEDDKVHFKLGRQSLIHYLLDSTRNTLLPFDCSRVHELAATYLLEQKIEKCVYYDKEINQYFAYHCQYAHLNETLRTYLVNEEFSFPQSIIVPMLVDPTQLPTTLWYMFRTFSREDFDSTRRKLTKYLVRWHQHVGATTLKTIYNGVVRDSSLPREDVDKLKGEVDMILACWNPPNFNSVNGKFPFLMEDRVFCHSAPVNAISSSIYGKYFMHSYDLLIDCDTVGVGVKKIDLNLRTYSMDGKLAYWSTYKNLQRGVRAALKDLDKVGKYLLSDSYQRYGIEPDDELSG